MLGLLLLCLAWALRYALLLAIFMDGELIFAFSALVRKIACFALLFAYTACLVLLRFFALRGLLAHVQNYKGIPL